MDLVRSAGCGVFDLHSTLLFSHISSGRGSAPVTLRVCPSAITIRGVNKILIMHYNGQLCVCNQNKFLPKRDLTERVANDPQDPDWIFCPKLRGGNYAPGHETQFNCSLCSVVQMSAVASGNQSSPSWINNESLCTNI